MNATTLGTAWVSSLGVSKRGTGNFCAMLMSMMCISSSSSRRWMKSGRDMTEKWDMEGEWKVRKCVMRNGNERRWCTFTG